MAAEAQFRLDRQVAGKGPRQEKRRRRFWLPTPLLRGLGGELPGKKLSLAVLRLELGKFGFVDSLGGRMEGSQKLVCELTLRAGRVVWDLNGLARGPWQDRTQYSVDPKWDGLLPPRR